MEAKNRTIVILILLITTISTVTFAHTNLSTIAPKNPETCATIIETLQNGERYTIEITSIGCFNGTRQTITVSKHAGIFTVNFQETIKILSDSDIEAFINFELQLESLRKGGCTTVDTYIIRYNGKQFRTSDGTCSWLGGKKLLSAIS